MPPKPKGDTKGRKLGRPLKEVIPHGKQPREGLPPPVPTVGEPSREFDCLPPVMFPPWPGDEAAEAHNFDAGTEFEDDFEYCFPPSWHQFTDNILIDWQRPEEYILNNEIVPRIAAPSSRQVRAREEASNTSADDLAKLQIVPVNEREETEEEFEKRKEAELNRLAAAKKKLGKGEEILPGMTKEVKLGNMDMGNSMPTFSTWMSSQLQMIKDRGWKDPDTDKGVWSRIYPQRDGVPVISKSRKYWVKMLHLGSDVLVEIDDSMPVKRSDGKLLIPHCAYIRDIWATLLCKAFLKLSSPKWQNISEYVISPEDEIDGSFIYSITGLMPQKMNINNIDTEEWTILEEILCDENWENSKNLISVHAEAVKQQAVFQRTSLRVPNKQGPRSPEKNVPMTPGITPTLPPSEEHYKARRLAAQIKVDTIKPASENDVFEITSATTKKRPADVFRSLAIGALAAKGKKIAFAATERPNYIIPGFGYLLFDIFKNDVDFDMAKVKVDKKNKEDSKISKKRYGGKNSKSRNAMSPTRLRDQEKRKQRREKEKEERRHKLQEIKVNPQFQLLLIKTAVANVPIINIYSPFTRAEIAESKLRMLNPEYFMEEEKRELEEQFMREDKELFDTTESSVEVTKQEITTHEIPNIDEENKEEVGALIEEEEEEPEDPLKRPLQRLVGGQWINALEFTEFFSQFTIYHQPKTYEHNILVQDAWKELDRAYQQTNSSEVLILDPPEIEEGEEAQPVELLVSYAPVIPQPLKFQPKSITLAIQKYDFENEEILEWTEEVKLTTTSVLAYKFFLLPQEQLVFRPQITGASCGYSLWLSSNSALSNMSKSEYLTTRCEWSQKSYVNDYFKTEIGCYSVYFKYDIRNNEENRCILKLSGPDYYLFRNMSLILIDRDQLEAEEDQRIYEINDHKLLPIETLQERRFTFPQNEKGYRLILLGLAPYAFDEGQITLDILSKIPEQPEVSIIDHIEPLEFTDLYHPNKYGLIFKEFVHLCDETIVSIHVKMRKGGFMPPTDKRTKEFVPTEEVPLANNRLIILTIHDKDKPILTVKGYNQAIFSHINLPHQGHEYLITCHYDLAEWPEAVEKSEENEEVNWVMRICSSETVCVTRDTRKEDAEEAIRKSWEDQQPGRAEMARNSRARYLAQQKKCAGEDLTEEEAKMTEETWEQMRKARKDAAEAAVKGGKKKEDKKVKEEEHEESVKTVPRPENNTMIQVKQFLSHVHSQRTIHKQGETPVEIEAEEVEAIHAKISEDIEAFNADHEQKVNDKRELVAQRQETLKAKEEALVEKREEFKTLIGSYRENREKYREVVKTRKDSTMALKQAVSQPPQNLDNFEDMIAAAVENNAPAALVSQGRTLVKKIRITRLTEALLKALKDQQLEPLKNQYADVEASGLIELVDSRVVHRASRLINAAAFFASVLEKPDEVGERIPEIEQMVATFKGPIMFKQIIDQVEKLVEQTRVKIKVAHIRATIASKDRDAIREVIDGVRGMKEIEPSLIKEGEDTIIKISDEAIKGAAADGNIPALRDAIQQAKDRNAPPGLIKEGEETNLRLTEEKIKASIDSGDVLQLRENLELAKGYTFKGEFIEKAEVEHLRLTEERIINAAEAGERTEIEAAVSDGSAYGIKYQTMAIGNEKMVDMLTEILKNAIEAKEEAVLAAEIPIATAMNSRLVVEIQTFRDNFEKMMEERKAATKKAPKKKVEDEEEEFTIDMILDLQLDPSLITQADYTLNAIRTNTTLVDGIKNKKLEELKTSIVAARALNLSADLIAQASKILTIIPLENGLRDALNDEDQEQIEIAVQNAGSSDVDQKLLMGARRVLAEANLRKVLYTEDDEILEKAIEDAKDVQVDPELIKEAISLLELE